ncbi:MAG TPA: arginine--tRNA ligase, partial [Thermoanaerobaculia bacterium]|nr:arginine--tRNA ligase [Thermoanaerobaculia bacterium]
MNLETVILELEEILRSRILADLGQAVDRIVLQTPPRLAMGDLATPVALELARAMRKPPREIATRIASGLTLPALVRSATVEGAGYINFRLDRSLFTAVHLDEVFSPPERSGERILVEHTNINPNKAAHIGHLRNAVLGDTLVRCLRWLGHDVETQNYIDDTGVQVADVVVGFQRLLGEGPEQVRARIEQSETPFDYFCWDLYAGVARHYEQDPESKSWRLETLHQIEKQEGAVADLAALIAEAIVHRHVATMWRLGIRYDVLTEESDIIKLRFWESAFEKLKQSGAVVLESGGRHAGCWVMKLADAAEFEGLEEPDKILVRSNGTVTYVGKDIAYQLWKFGLIDRTFQYRPFHRYPDGEVVWQTTSDEGDPSAPAFGGADRVVNVIDIRQAYLQKIVREGLRLLGHQQAADRSVHFSYEMVALSSETVAAMGIAMSEEDASRAVVEMSGRKGVGIKADDLIDELERKAEQAVREGMSGERMAMEEEEQLDLARQIAVGALRYFMLKFGRNKVIAFDLAEALTFEGDSGPYLQYSTVRVQNIFRKMDERGVSAGLGAEGRDRLTLTGEMDDEMWEIVRLSAETTSVVRRAVDALELSLITHHALELAQKFNTFYHKYPIL